MTEDSEMHWQRVKWCADGGYLGGFDKCPYEYLTASITGVSGYVFTDHKSDKWLQGFCEGLIIQSALRG